MQRRSVRYPSVVLSQNNPDIIVSYRLKRWLIFFKGKMFTFEACLNTFQLFKSAIHLSLCSGWMEISKDVIYVRQMSNVMNLRRVSLNMCQC